MASNKPYAGTEIRYDSVSVFPDGINLGDDPLTLPKTQLANATNGTLRGNFFKPRPKMRKMNFTSSGDFQTGLFQGGAYYRSTTAQGSLFAAISGRLWQFIPGTTDCTVIEQTIPSDPSSELATQHWLWQSEMFLIWNDGIHNPVFFDGNTSRRSAGYTTPFTNVAGGGFTAPDIGATVAVVLAANYTGPQNAILAIGDGVKYLFQVIGTNQLLMKYWGATAHPGNLTGPFYNLPAIGRVDSFSTPSFTVTGFLQNIPIFLVAPYHDLNALDGVDIFIQPGNGGIFVGKIIASGSNPSAVNSYGVANTQLMIEAHSSSGTFSMAGRPLVNLQNGGGGTVLFQTASSFVQPPNQGTVPISIDSGYNGPLNAYVWKFEVDGPWQYEVLSIVPFSPGTGITVKNLNAQSGSIFPAGATDTVGFPNELPAGRAGAYWLGRNWVALTDGLSFVASDIVNGISGTPAYQGRDAPLRIYENSLLSGGGTFVVPGSVGDIRAIVATVQLDASYGQGPLKVVTPLTIFTCNAPVDRNLWAAVTNPILPPSIIAKGGLGPWAVSISNSDLIYRSQDGIRSEIIGRRQFGEPGNTPQSYEVSPVLAEDDPALLPWCSMVIFDNRLLTTTAPVQSTLGVYWTKLVVLNFDEVSSLRVKEPTAYDPFWTGLNVLQLIGDPTGKNAPIFNGVERQFAFCVSDDKTKIELWEILPSNGPNSEIDETIVQEFETSSLFRQPDQDRQLLDLKNGEIWVDKLTGSVKFEIFWKPDQWPSFVPWFEWTETFDASKGDPGFRPRMGFGEPPIGPVYGKNGRPLRIGYSYQIKVRVIGNCRILGLSLKVASQPQTEFAVPSPTGTIPVSP